MRLDFETFSIRGTGNTEEVDAMASPATSGGACLDVFDIMVGLLIDMENTMSCNTIYIVELEAPT